MKAVEGREIVCRIGSLIIKRIQFFGSQPRLELGFVWSYINEALVPWVDFVYFSLLARDSFINPFSHKRISPLCFQTELLWKPATTVGIGKAKLLLSLKRHKKQRSQPPWTWLIHCLSSAKLYSKNRVHGCPSVMTLILPLSCCFLSFFDEGK